MVNYRGTSQDAWATTLRYNLSLPLVSKLSWFATIDISNPFNHRGIGNWFSPGGPSTTVVPVAIPGGSAYTNPYGTGANPLDWVWRTDANVNTQYRTRMSGRIFYVQSGLRF